MSAAMALYRLQLVDREIDRIRGELDSNQRQLDDDASLRRAREHERTSRDALQAARRDLGAAESAAAAQRAKIDEVEASLYGGRVTNPRELQDLQADGAALKKSFSKLEDAELERMGAMESAERAMREAESALEQANAAAAGMRQRLIAKGEALAAELQRLSVERDAAFANVSAQFQAAYQELRRAKRGLAISEVADGACSACGSALGAALVQAARSMHTLAHCPTCGRVLYAA
jgi:predicted  nucleic acid-binding Zn-ribbon protein